MKISTHVEIIQILDLTVRCTQVPAK